MYEICENLRSMCENLRYMNGYLREIVVSWGNIGEDWRDNCGGIEGGLRRMRETWEPL